jgi:methyltransferase (TIGR00027 family)
MGTVMTPETEPIHNLGVTARWTAAVRALENGRADRLFFDPWAALLAGSEGHKWINDRSIDSVSPIILRTRYFDDFLQYVARTKQIHQIVLIAAGLDTRAFRLSWPEQTQMFELDQASVLDEKEAILKSSSALPSCNRKTVKTDLTTAWSDSLMAAGFNPDKPSGWLLEGFLFYVPIEMITAILSEVSKLAVSSSWLGFDIMNSISLNHPLTKLWIEMQTKAGAPWIGTMDNPAVFLSEKGWKPKITQAGQPDANYGRWPFPVIPTMMPEMPHNWFITAEKS